MELNLQMLKTERIFLQTVILMAALFSSLTSAEILSVHCPLGCPSNPTKNDLVFGHLYALSNNPTTKFADWVAYEVDVRNFGDSPGRNWAADPFLSAEETLEKEDYKGANKLLDTDRGHQAPLASFAGSMYWSELNYLSNITPQKKDLNQGSWQRLEQAVRDASKFRDSMYVITGPIFGTDSQITLPHADELHRIPTAYFKIVYDKRGNAAFFRFSQLESRDVKFCSKQVSFTKLQSELDFSVPKFSSSELVLARLGCA